MESENVLRLRGYLLGRDLPALGGDLSPADILRRAVPIAGKASTVLPLLARLLAGVIAREAGDMASDRQVSEEGRYLLLNALDLAADLPTEESLSLSLQILLETLKGADGDSVYPLRLPLWRGLVFHQVDASLEPEWFSILKAANQEWTPARRTLLLTAWRGILWIPPTPERQRSGEIVDFDRLERGLWVLYGAVAHQEKSIPFLKACLDILGETYPRASEFWADHFAPRALPKGLRALILEKWPVRSLKAG